MRTLQGNGMYQREGRSIGIMYTVLVAENEPWVLRGIVEMVKAAGEEFEVVGACSNGEEAWNLIQEVWPMLLITDIMMPELDGLSLIRRIEEQRTPLVSVIVSGYDNFQYAQQAIVHGVSEYLLKPVEFDTLKQALQRAKEKVGSLKELNAYLLKFQALLDNGWGLAPKDLMRKQDELLQSVLRLNRLNRNARAILLRLFEDKLKTLLNGSGIAYSSLQPADRSDDGTIALYFQALLERWYLNQPGPATASTPEAIQRSCRYVQAHFKEEITLTEMAARTNFSVSHFSALFKKHTGQSLVGYVNRLRVDKAKKLLRSTSFSVAEIAEMTGFSSTSYFTRVFKASIDLPPLEYKKRMNP
ncbi:response regulator [Cohnella sp. REN36]|uniref:response regulator n=1 Tax=Cohnella sp. REN36 TaxID=2887347 RepID=UPI001D13B115|nr:response regulator [Cohnella sp. REN36]MCC3376740.1 response regulator [Cohnella sp. REN36]